MGGDGCLAATARDPDGITSSKLETCRTVNGHHEMDVVLLKWFVYIATSERTKETWTGFSMHAFSGLWAFLKLSSSSAVMLCLEMWYFQILILIAGLLENPEIALDWLALQVTKQCIYDSVRVSNELGAGHPKSAAFAVVVVTLSSFVISVICAISLLALRHVVSYAFTDGETVAMQSQNLPLCLRFPYSLMASNLSFQGLRLDVDGKHVLHMLMSDVIMWLEFHLVMFLPSSLTMVLT
ncbi:hypothetical protein L1987_12600 [Smallanthus sonchifolius]|uniref:Uncharacterized protein n=1 Tax=Smallanthus sonchifolius TaxID=185202 RepID=A0ACB9JE66_9ASTR|nr:hypothetical protein L1987_12600 [Smallanthus sonchifolius]